MSSFLHVPLIAPLFLFLFILLLITYIVKNPICAPRKAPLLHHFILQFRFFMFYLVVRYWCFIRIIIALITYILFCYIIFLVVHLITPRARA